MATPTCIKCGGKIFELQGYDIPHTFIHVEFIQCATCGGVVSMSDSNIICLINKFAKKTGIDINK